MTSVQTQIDKLAARVDAHRDALRTEIGELRDQANTAVAALWRRIEHGPTPPDDGDHGAENNDDEDFFRERPNVSCTITLDNDDHKGEYYKVEYPVGHWKIPLIREVLRLPASSGPEDGSGPDEASIQEMLDERDAVDWAGDSIEAAVESLVTAIERSKAPYQIVGKNSATHRRLRHALGLATPADRAGVVTDAMVGAGGDAIYGLLHNDDTRDEEWSEEDMARVAIEAALAAAEGGTDA